LTYTVKTADWNHKQAEAASIYVNSFVEDSLSDRFVVRIINRIVENGLLKNTFLEIIASAHRDTASMETGLVLSY